MHILLQLRVFRDYYYQTFEPDNLSKQTGIYPCWTGELKASANYHCSSRILDDYFMIYVKKGAGDFKSGSSDFRLIENDYFFLFPGVMHSYYTSPQYLMELYWIGFNGFLANSLLKKLNIHPSGPILRPEEQGCSGIPSKMHELIHSPAEGEPLGRTAGLLGIFSRLIASEAPPAQQKEEGGKGRSDRILRALSYIDSNFTEDMSIGELAAYVNMSRSAFSRLFSKETGRSPQAFLIEIRLEQAVHLLSGNMPVKEVARASGFRDEYYFSRCFKKKYGLPPNAVRKELKKILSLNSTAAGDKTWL